MVKEFSLQVKIEYLGMADCYTIMYEICNIHTFAIFWKFLFCRKFPNSSEKTAGFKTYEFDLYSWHIWVSAYFRFLNFPKSEITFPKKKPTRKTGRLQYQKSTLFSF